MSNPDTDLNQAFQQAIADYKYGELDAAMSRCQSILAIEPDNYAANEMIVMLYAGKADYPNAVKHLKTVIQLNPGNADALNNLGLSYHYIGSTKNAEKYLSKAIENNPHSAEAFSNLGLINIAQKKYADAEAYLKQALKLNPKYVKALRLLGAAQQAQKKYTACILTYQKAISSEPNHESTYLKLGKVYTKQKRLNKALIIYEKLLLINPSSSDAYQSIGYIHALKHQHKKCIKYSLKAIKHKPNDFSAHNNLSFSYLEINEISLAEKHIKKALSLNPDSAEAHFNYSLILLLKADFFRGWKEYQWRLKHKGVKVYPHDSSEWKGEPLEGKTILIQSEQGLGDMIMAIRFIQLIKKESVKLILECHKQLIPLFKNLPEVDMLVLRGEKLPDADYHVPILNLPLILGLDIDSITPIYPYLKADSNRVNEWSQRLGKKNSFRVGIAWQGNPKFSKDHRRSLPLKQFLPLLSLKGVEFISVQKKNTTTNQLDDFTDKHRIIDVDAGLDRDRDFMDTAAIMENLDLLICTDSSVANLAGALGLPTWLILGAPPDWRWLLDTDASPWYPSIRLFRQETQNDWQHVLQQIRTELSTLISGQAKD